MLNIQKEDFYSGFFVFLIALPLCMGIAMASGFPTVAGIITAIVGGFIASFLGSSRLTIKGPAAGLIVIAVGAVQELGMGDPILGYKRCLAVGVIAAISQILFAKFKFGKIAELMPPSVVHGMLAAIGVIIISKQIHLLFGVTPFSKSPVQLLEEIPHSIMNLNPEVFTIGIISFIILIAFPYLRFSFTKKVPAPLLAIAIAVPLALIFDFEHAHQYSVWGHIYQVGPNYLVNLPGNIFEAITYPDFSAIGNPISWKYIVMFSLVGTVESLLTVSAVDSIDPANKTSDLNKDLFAVGIGNLVASSIGGLPMISEIVRSKANIDNGAKSHWANFFHGTFLILFITIFPSFLMHIPLAVLSAMLVYTGYRLASPKEFFETYHMGKDQFILFISTLLVTLFSDLLIGVATGVVLKIALHKLRGAEVKYTFKTDIKTRKENGGLILNVEGASIFTNYLSLKQKLDELREEKIPIKIDFSRSSIVDLTVQTKLRALQREIGEDRLMITGLNDHKSASSFPSSTKVLNS